MVTDWRNAVYCTLKPYTRQLDTRGARLDTRGARSPAESHESGSSSNRFVLKLVQLKKIDLPEKCVKCLILFAKMARLWPLRPKRGVYSTGVG